MLGIVWYDLAISEILQKWTNVTFNNDLNWNPFRIPVIKGKVVQCDEILNEYSQAGKGKGATNFSFAIGPTHRKCRQNTENGKTADQRQRGTVVTLADDGLGHAGLDL